MGKYAESHSCGHDFLIQLGGKIEERMRVLERMQEENCSACQAKAAAIWATANNLPVLQGSPKQIAWAHTLRKNQLEKAQDLIWPAATNLTEVDKNAGEKMHRHILAELIKQNCAEFWIDYYKVAKSGYSLLVDFLYKNEKILKGATSLADAAPILIK